MASNPDYDFFEKYGYLPDKDYHQPNASGKKKHTPIIVAALVLVVVIFIVGGVLIKNYVSNAVDIAHQEGFDAGYAEGKSEGFRKGYDTGASIGYWSGYDDGKLAAESSSSDDADNSTPMTFDEWTKKYIKGSTGSSKN